MVLLLLPTPPASTADSSKHAGLGGYPYTKEVSHAGRAYYQRKMRGRTDLEAAALLEKENVVEEPDQDIGDVIEGGNYYEVLGLKEVGYDATGDQIKRAYHKALIVHHPDKTGRGETDPLYLSIQDAFNTLSVEAKRRSYDSQCDFDDSIPGDKFKGNFYDVYGAVFTRNARFATVKPVPTLGDDNTPLDVVDEFYDYWLKFDSWREFTHDAEHDIDAVDSRYAKRSMAKENEAAARKKKKAEYARLSNLVDRAMKADPRLVREKARKKAEKEAAKQAKIDAKLAEEAAIAAEAAAVKAAEEEEAAAAKLVAQAAKAVRDADKKALQKARRAVRKLGMAVGGDAAFEAEDEIELLCEKLATLELKKLADDIGEKAGSEPFEAAKASEAWGVLIAAAAETKRIDELPVGDEKTAALEARAAAAAAAEKVRVANAPPPAPKPVAAKPAAEKKPTEDAKKADTKGNDKNKKQGGNQQQQGKKGKRRR